MLDKKIFYLKELPFRRFRLISQDTHLGKEEQI